MISENHNIKGCAPSIFLKRLFLLVLAAIPAVSCLDVPESGTPEGRRNEKVLILCSIGCNSIDSDLQYDIDELLSDKESIPMAGSDNVLILLSHFKKNGTMGREHEPPVIVCISSDYLGRPQRDTLMVMGKDDRFTDKQTMRRALEFVRDRFDADSYGIIFSSHGTGWLPIGYFRDPSKIEGSPQSDEWEWTLFSSLNRKDLYPWSDEPPVKTFGSEEFGSDYYEITIQDLKDAIPMHMDYIIFDACMMGGIEVAYELRNTADLVCFSQAEVASDGFDYKNLLKRLLGNGPADPVGVCQDYYTQSLKTQITYGSTVSAIDCSGMETMAEVCGRIFSKYREALANVDSKKVQIYYRHDRHYFYDLRDILIKAGVSGSDMEEFDRALESVVVYKAATSAFMVNSGGFKITCHSGFSMYLPNRGTEYLNDFYKTLEWNRDTGLVQ